MSIQPKALLAVCLGAALSPSTVAAATNQSTADSLALRVSCSEKTSQNGPQPRSSDPSQESNAQALVAQARTLMTARRFDEAIELLKRAIEVEPKLAVAHTQLAVAFIEKHQMTVALDEATRAIELDPRNYFPHYLQGYAQRALRRYPEAIAAFKESVALNPNNFAPYAEMGNAYLDMFRYAEAAEALQQAVKLAPNDANTWNTYAIAQYRSGQREAGIESLKKAVTLNPNLSVAYLNLGRWYHQMGRYEDAAQNLSELIRIAPRLPDAYFERSLDYFYLGRGEAAATDAMKFLELTDWHSERAGYMVVTAALGYRIAGRPEEAQRVLQLSAKRSDTAGWPYRIISYLNGEMSGDALLSMAANNNDRLTEAHAYVAMDLMLRDQRQAATQHFEWVREHGNKAFVEYTLAGIALEKIKTGADFKQ